MSVELLQDLYNNEKQLFVLYKTKQFQKQFFDISKVNYTNKESKLYYYEFFFDENTSSSLKSIYIKTENLIHNMQLNYYTLQLHSQINKLLYTYDNQFITMKDKLYEIDGTTIYIYPFILIYNNKLYYVKNNYFSYTKNDYVFEVSVPLQNIDINKKLQLFIKINKSINYFSEISEKTRIFKGIGNDNINDFLGLETINYLQSINKSSITSQINDIIPKLNDYYLSTSSLQEKLNVEQLYNDVIKIILLLKYKISNNTINTQFINYLESHLDTISNLLNEKLKYDEMYSNSLVDTIINNQVYKLSQIVNILESNQTLENILDTTTDNTLKNYFNTIENQIVTQLNNMDLNDNLLNRMTVVFLNLLNNYFLEGLLDIQRYLTNESDIYNSLYSLYNSSVNEVTKLINEYNNRTLKLPSYKDLFNLYIKMYNSNIIVDSELNSQLTPIIVTSTQLVTTIDKRFKKQNDYIILNGNLYMRDKKYDNVYINKKSEYNSDDFDTTEILIYLGDIVFLNSSEVNLLI